MQSGCLGLQPAMRRVAACDAAGRRACLSEEARSPFGPVYFLYARPLAVVCIAHLGMHASVG